MQGSEVTADMDLTHTEIEELLGAYALDAVETEERAAIAAHLDECPRCRAEVEAHLEVAGLLGNAGAAAPPGIWDRIADQLEGTPPPTVFPLDRARVPAPARRWSTGARVAIAAVAAVSVLLAGLALVTIRDQQQEIDDLAARVEASGTDDPAADALADPDSRLVDLESGDGALAVRAVVSPDGAGYLLGEDLPALATDRTYQLWALTPDDTISLGVLGHAPGVFAFHVDDPTTGLALTEEEAGGVDQTENSPLVSGTLA
jgi:anti-sigma-K factor RskA